VSLSGRWFSGKEPYKVPKYHALTARLTHRDGLEAKGGPGVSGCTIQFGSENPLTMKTNVH